MLNLEHHQNSSRQINVNFDMKAAFIYYQSTISSSSETNKIEDIFYFSQKKEIEYVPFESVKSVISGHGGYIINDLQGVVPNIIIEKGKRFCESDRPVTQLGTYLSQHFAATKPFEKVEEHSLPLPEIPRFDKYFYKDYKPTMYEGMKYYLNLKDLRINLSSKKIFKDIYNANIIKIKDIIAEMRYQIGNIDNIKISTYKESFISTIYNYWESIPEKDERNSIVVFLIDSIKNLSINIKKEQIDLLENIIDTINIGDIEEKQIMEIFETMIGHGLNPAGSLQGLSEIYEEIEYDF